MTVDRRTFLKGALAAPAAATLPAFFARALFAGEPDNRILVLVQLDGGNDGLNTVVPYGDDAYHRARPGVGVAAGQVVKLDEYHGLHPSLGGLQGVWDDGALGILQGIGYANPSRSHFTSSDIWHTASTAPQGRWTGWLGRTLDRAKGLDIPALHLDPGPLSLALVGERVVVPSIADAQRFVVRGNKELLASVADRARTGDALEYVRRSARQAYKTAARVETALKGGTGADAYPKTDLGRRLYQVARLIEAGFGARVYAVRLSGFDTHSRQKDAHAQLLKMLGDALGTFQKDLTARNLSKRVLTVTYSEFGRRVKENRSLGTDHGTAAPMFVMGSEIKGGLHGDHPSLTLLERGDLKHHTDFRSAYATVLERWLKTDSKAVLGQAYTPIPFL